MGRHLILTTVAKWEDKSLLGKENTFVKTQDRRKPKEVVRFKEEFTKFEYIKGEEEIGLECRSKPGPLPSPPSFLPSFPH